MTKFDPNNHIVGKVYDLTQENFHAVILAYEDLLAFSKPLIKHCEDLEAKLLNVEKIILEAKCCPGGPAYIVKKLKEYHK